jgi:hypothetical protein
MKALKRILTLALILPGSVFIGQSYLEFIPKSWEVGVKLQPNQPEYHPLIANKQGFQFFEGIYFKRNINKMAYRFSVNYYEKQNGFYPFDWGCFGNNYGCWTGYYPATQNSIAPGGCVVCCECCHIGKTRGGDISMGYQRYFGSRFISPYIFSDLLASHSRQYYRQCSYGEPYTADYLSSYVPIPYQSEFRRTTLALSGGLGIRLIFLRVVTLSAETSVQYFQSFNSSVINGKKSGPTDFESGFNKRPFQILAGITF